MNYLEAARTGYGFLQKHLLDPVHGGYYWSTNDKGEVLDDRKYLQGAQALQNAAKFS